MKMLLWVQLVIREGSAGLESGLSMHYCAVALES